MDSGINLFVKKVNESPTLTNQFKENEKFY